MEREEVGGRKREREREREKRGRGEERERRGGKVERREKRRDII